MGLEPCAEKPWGAAQRRGAEYSSPSSIVHAGAKPELAEVPPGQLQRLTLRPQRSSPLSLLSPFYFLSPFSSRLSLWLATSDSGFSITP